LDHFLEELVRRNVHVFMVSGNHDSAERLAFGSTLISKSNVFISPAYSGKVAPWIFEDAYGAVCVYALPFVKPVHVRMAHEDCDAHSYTDAVRTAIENMDVDPSMRNVIISHQFVTGALRSDSEEISVGGSDNVDVSIFDGFDYVALGHLHRPQKVGRETVRYSGTPLKYSFSECNDAKSVPVIEMREKGDISIRLIPLKPLHDLRVIRGSYDELTLRKNYEGTNTEDYIHVILTDEDDVLDAAERLRTIYPNLMQLSYDNKRTQASGEITFADNLAAKSPTELFGEFFEMQNNAPMSDAQVAYLSGVMEKIWEE
jgi:exonuclease SbcD